MSVCLMPAAYYSNTRWTPATTTGVHVTAEVEQGTLRGQEKISKFFPDDKYYSFEYIPYAKPPEGPLRFKEPQEPEPWTGVRDAFGVDELQAADTVPQKKPTTITDQFVSPPKVTDDCLYLDVDTPQLGDKRKPVIVWIHPLRFTEESAFGPQYFGVGQYMQEDVVLVTVRYRQNVLGFLCLDHEEVCCNAGLKDQVMALKWIQRNVSKFGGDPNNITLYGFGTAAAFVHYHLMSPLSEGLFHRVIIQGDCALNPHMYTPREIAIKRAFKLGKALDWDTDNTDDLLEFLKAVPVTDLVEAARKTLDLGENQLVFSTPFTPCVEVPATDKSFLPQPPRELLKQGRFAKVPIIMGTTDHVGRISLALVRENEEVIYGDTDYESGTWGAFVGNPVGNETPPEWMKDVQNVYFGHKPSNYDVPDICGKLLCDFAYHYGCDESIRTQLENTEQPIYAFEFRLFSVENPMKPLMYGDTHRLYRDNFVYSGLIKMWTSFAKTRNLLYNGRNNMQAWGLIVLLISKAAGHLTVDEKEEDESAGVLHSQRALAEITEMIRTGHLVHKGLVNIYPGESIERCSLNDMTFGNKIALLSGDYLLSNAWYELANLRNQEVVEMMGTALRDITLGEFLGRHDKQNNPLPSSLTDALADWTERNELSAGSLLGKACQGTLKLAGHGVELQEQGYKFGKHLALAWQACLDLEPFTVSSQYMSGSVFSLTSAPVMFHLERDKTLLVEIDRGLESVQHVDYAKIHEIVSGGPGIGLTNTLRKKHAQKAMDVLQVFEESDARTALSNIIIAMGEL